MNRLTVAAGAVFAAAALGAPWSPIVAQTPSLVTTSPCTFGFGATAVPGEPNAATVRLNYAVPLPGGTVTAYGATTRWSGTVDRFASVKRDFSPEIFRCITVPSVYVFAVEYMP